eukprot:868535-Pleurochrysis_carterae.AAC.1
MAHKTSNPFVNTRTRRCAGLEEQMTSRLPMRSKSPLPIHGFDPTTDADLRTARGRETAASHRWRLSAPRRSLITAANTRSRSHRALPGDRREGIPNSNNRRSLEPVAALPLQSTRIAVSIPPMSMLRAKRHAPSPRATGPAPAARRAQRQHARARIAALSAIAGSEPWPAPGSRLSLRRQLEESPHASRQMCSAEPSKAQLSQKTDK